MTITELQEKLAGYLAKVSAEENILGEMIDYHLSSGGKAIRGVLALQEAEFQGVPLERALPWAAACELLHNATLVHDDIQDDDPLRRGQESVWKRYGIPQAINVGDTLLFQAYRCLANSAVADRTMELVNCLSRCAEQLVLGQALELDLTANPKGDLWEQYKEIARLKTGALLQACVEGIHLLSERSIEESTTRSAPWSLLGVVYQINDDVNDFMGQKQANQSQKDFVEKRMNALIAYLARSPEHKALVDRYCEAEKESAEHMQCLTELTPAIEAAYVCEQLREKVTGWLQEFDQAIDSPAKERVVSFFGASSLATAGV